MGKEVTRVRSLWKGVLSFGLVSIPVRLYAATEQRDVHLRYLHQPCAAPIQYRKVCTACGQEVPPEQIVLGYEASPGTFVLLREEELAALPSGPDHSVEIERFVPQDHIDPIFLDRAYYLEPQPGGHKAYQLLYRAMAAENRVAVVRIALRRRERWAAVRPGSSGVLHLETLLDADEVRPAREIAVGEPAELRPGELDLAQTLVRTLSAEFHPEDNPDRYRAALESLIAQKLEARETATPQVAQAERARVIDLMEALRASIQEAGAERSAILSQTDGPTPSRQRKGGTARAAKSRTPPPPARTHAGAGSRGSL
jgi:DNA end-binding protein Ku